jgi:hypothetical protein
MVNDEDDPQPSSRRPMGPDDYSAERVIRRNLDSQATALQGKPVLPSPPRPSVQTMSIVEEPGASDGLIPVHVDSTPPESAERIVSEAEWTPDSMAAKNALGRERSGNTPSPTAVGYQPRFWAVVVAVTALGGVAMFLLGRLL